MAQPVGRNIAAPLLFLNLVMYVIMLGFAIWCLNRYINGQTYHPSFGSNEATGFFLTFAMLAAVIGIAPKCAGGSHIRAWRNESLAAAGSASLIAWDVTALAFGYGPGYRDTEYGVEAGGQPIPKGGGGGVCGSRV